jgi:extracellular elastinolytic metalloproteinase
MKNLINILDLLVSLFGFSQMEKQLLQSYLESNASRFDLKSTDISNWKIQSTGTSADETVQYYYLIQQYNDVEIFRALFTASVKNNVVIYGANSFVSNVKDKVNSSTPNLSAVVALQKAYAFLNIVPSQSLEVVQTIDKNHLVISNGLGLEENVTATLVYQPIENALKLAWDFTIYTPKYNHLWSVRIDALTGKMLEKNDLTVSCDFNTNRSCYVSNHDHKTTTSEVSSFNLNKPSNFMETQGGAYRVIPFNFESPNHTARQLISNPDNATASPKGWHDTNTLTGNFSTNKFTYTRGNNVWARADYDNTNPTTHSTTSTSTGFAPDGGSALNFDFPYGGNSVVANTYISAASTNLFYMNNIMHDVWNFHGFNAANGNFQQTNYTTVASPASGDAVWADAQDGSTSATPTFNNANFSTPVDGQKPRMQMFLWSYRKVTQLLNVNSPSDIAGLKFSGDNSFNPGHVNVPVSPSAIETNLVLFDDGTPDVGQTDNADACSSAVNAAAINGKIVVIRRSTSVANGGNPCTFIEKVQFAQAANAIAVIIVNNDLTAPDTYLGMSGAATTTITIPAISVSLNTGEAIIAKLKAGQTVNAKIQSPTALDLFVNTDGDFDNGVIAHEFGHGISTRLAGGRANSSCLQNYDNMGEGWSDWFAMMMQMKTGDVGATPKGLATFVLNQETTGGGLRSYPYTTNMSINPLTYINSNTPTPDDPADTGYRYVQGDFWATVLWDLAWKYVETYGYDDNKYTGTGGNNKVMKLVLDGLKAQPCSPTVIDGRDALIAADQATAGGVNKCLITEVFRRRGVGLNASAGSNQDPNDQVEDFTPYAGCSMGTDTFNTKDIYIYPNPTNSIFNLKVNGYSGKLSIKVIDLNGRVILEDSEDNASSIKTINLSAFQAGMYIVKVQGDDLNFTQKLIKN